jgi:3-phenylpropionate/trans-cinnamate dioxygenase ferredoxin reductase subunit
MLAAFEGNGRVEAVRLADGSRIECDVAVVGIGILPCDELAKSCGIDCSDGIVVDRDARTSDPRIFAAGDCTRRPLVHYAREGRLESVHNAIEQGKIVAAAILGRDRPAEDVPWFWSDQYDLKLQIAGLGAGYDRIVVRGNPDERKFAAFYLRGGALLAVDAIGSPMEFMASKQLIARAARPDPAALADTGVSMKDIVAAHRNQE